MSAPGPKSIVLDMDQRPVGRPPNDVRRYYANFSYQAGSWTKLRRVIAKVERHPGELVLRVGFIVTNMSRPAERIAALYNKRGTCEQWVRKDGGRRPWTKSIRRQKDQRVLIDSFPT